MGYSLPELPEPDYRNVAKKLVKVEKPCVPELMGLMDCMKVEYLVFLEIFAYFKA
jgi:hypothetical protein